MWFMRERIRAWPLRWIFAYYAAAFGLIVFIVGSFIDGGGPGWAALAGLLFASFMTPVTWWERNREKSR